MARKSSSGIVTAGLLVIAIMGGVFLWQPMKDEVTLLTSELETKQGQLGQLQAELSELVALEASLPVAETERARILERVPVGLVQDQLITDLSSIAQEVGVSLGAMTYALQESEEGANVVSIVGTFTGDYAKLVSLLQAIESNERLFRVASIGVQLAESTPQEGEEEPTAGVQQMNFSVTIEGFYQ